MSPLKQRLAEDRAMRDAARANVEVDLAVLKGEGSDQSTTERLFDGAKDLARTLEDGAMDMAGDSRGKLGGVLALGIAGVAAWIFRKPILDAVEGFFDETEEALAQEDTSSEMDDMTSSGSHDPDGADDE
jgi:hypothetical protein